MVHVHTLLAQVDAMSLQLEFAHIALDTCLVDEIGGIHLHLREVQFINHHLITEEGQQLHIYHHLLDVGYGIFSVS